MCNGTIVLARHAFRMDRERNLLTVIAVMFLASGWGTVHLCLSMSGGGMAMPGGWSMSMAWMRMPGQTWVGAAASFIGMWTLMMVAMMLPSLVPMLVTYRCYLRERNVSR